MARFSPSKINFNGGEVSDLIIQRTDLDRFSSFNRALLNYVSAPQGPAVNRSGTRYQHDAYKHAKYSAVVPFIFSDEQANLLEFSDLRMRILSEDGLLTTGFVSITNVVATTPFKFTSAALVAAGAAVGKQIAFAGFADARNLKGVVANVTAVAGNDITVDINYNGATGAVTGTGGLVYEVTTPYAHADVRKINYVQSLDVVYLFCSGYKPRKLSRLGETNWTLVEFNFLDGPYLDEQSGAVTPNGTGRANIVHSADIMAGPTGGTLTSVAGLHSGSLYFVMDADRGNSARSNAYQGGDIVYEFNTSVVLKGYSVAVPRSSSDYTVSARNVQWDNFKLEAWDGTKYVLLDEQRNYSLWGGLRTRFIELPASTPSYAKYKLSVTQLAVTGAVLPVFGEWILTPRTPKPFDLTFSAAAKANVNRGAGFLSTDVGRLIRVYQIDGNWRALKITAVVSTTVVTVECQGEALLGTEDIVRWRLGAFSDTTGWPTVGVFHDDRLCVGGAFDSPTAVAMSAPQSYDDMAPTEDDGSITAANALFLRPNTRNATPVRWLESTERGLMVGFGSGVWFIGPSAANNPFGATNAKAVEVSARGSASVKPARVDNDLLFVQQNKRTVRQLAYALDVDTFKATSVSLFASHMGKTQFEQIVYAAEPFSIAWLRTATGELKGLTYNKDENIIGWHRHDLAGGIVESVAVIPDGTHDNLWAVVQRTINGQTRRYIEKLMPFWDFGTEIDDMHYVDCGVRVTVGSPITTVYNAAHLEGRAIVGVADKIYFEATVTGGQFNLPNPASNIVYGLSYEMSGETANFEGGSQDGTSQAKVKRMHNMSLYLVQSYGGKVGVYNEDTDTYEYDVIEGDVHYKAENELGEPTLWTGFVGPFNPPQGYGKRGAVAFRQTLPYPFIVGGLYPQMNVEDRG